MKKIYRLKQLFNDPVATSSEGKTMAVNHRQKAYISYLTAGDGGIERTLNAALALIEGGSNLLEIGVPFSDPIADGPIIQRAAERALASGTTLQDILWLCKEIRCVSDVPIILFSYLNPILAALPSNFLRQAKLAGIDGLLLVDCPLEESNFFQKQCTENQLDMIYIISASTPYQRIIEINQHAQGFLYYACRKGTTGPRHELPSDFQTKIREIKRIVNYPVVVGFGISQREMAHQVLEHADGVVVGSLFVKMLEEGASPAQLSKIAREIFLG